MKLTTEANNGSEVIMEITGTKRDTADKHDLIVDLHLGGCDWDWDSFGVDTLTKETTIHLRKGTAYILNVSNTYEDYMRLIDELNLERPKQQSMEYWIPSTNDKYFCINSTGEVYGLPYYDEVSCTDNKRIENYNSFPTRELAEKAVNLSKLGRLILLWQYSNDCIFYPNWSDVWEDRYLVFYSNTEKKLLVQHTESSQEMLVYFKSKEQAAAFLEMYDKEIKNIIGVK